MSFEKYKYYKDTDVLWIERIPIHWLPMRLKNACLVFPSNVDKKSYEDQIPVHLCNYTDVYYNEKIVSGMDFMKATATQEQIEKFTLKAGDTIITKDSETADDIGISAFVPNDIPGVICGYHLSMVRPKSCAVGNYVKYFFTSHFAKSKLAVAANGLTRVGLSQYSLDNIYFPTPSIEEQCSIANFLDHETAKIDSLVTEQEKLIELLKEKRQAVISKAVTKGLDAKATMKDSGIKWLGEVPEHWSIERIRRFVKLNPSKSELGILDKTTEVSFLPMEAIGEEGTLSLEKTKPLSEVETGYTYFREGDVTVAKITPCFENGKGAVMKGLHNGFGFGTTELIVARPTEGKVIADFLYRLFSSSHFRKNAEGSMYGAGGQKRVSDDFIREFQTGLPPVNEQIEIAEFIDHETVKFESLIKEATSVITLLNERRSALITAAVTGQIDVRNYQPKEVA